VSQAEPQPMGFRVAAAVSSKPRLLLVASLAQADVSGLADYVAGADAGLLFIAKSGSGVKTLQKITQLVPDIPWGGWLKDEAGEGAVEQMAKAGGDFVVFPAADTPLAVPHGKEIGKVLQVEASLSEGLLRTVNGLPVDAVLIAGEEPGRFLTWHHLMLFRRLAGLLAKPLLVSVPAKVTADELQAIWDAGVDSIIVAVGVGQPAGGLKGLRQMIDKLTFPSSRQRGKAEALLPRIGGITEAAAEEEEEEE
jgi:hypothetical protein